MNPPALGKWHPSLIAGNSGGEDLKTQEEKATVATEGARETGTEEVEQRREDEGSVGRSRRAGGQG